MNEEQFLALLFIKNKGHKYNTVQIRDKFDSNIIVYLKEKEFIDRTDSENIYYYITPLGKKVCDSITPVLNLI
jgi:predicted transcriptional regulator